MSSADDDRDYEDDHRGDDREDSRPSPGAAERTRKRVGIPAILLIVTGAIGLVFTAINFVQLPGLDAKFDEMIDNADKNPNLPDDQKKQQKEIFAKAKEFMATAALPIYIVNGVVAVLVLVAGIKMRSLSGRGLAFVGSLFAMVPLVNGCCCILGLPAGIWALIVLLNADVKAGFEAAGRARQGAAEAP